MENKSVEQFCDAMLKRGDTMLQFRCLDHLNSGTTCFLDTKSRQMIVSCSKCERPIAYAELLSIPSLIK